MEKPLIIKKVKGYVVEIRWGLPYDVDEPWKEKDHVCNFPFQTKDEAEAFRAGFEAAAFCWALRTRREMVDDVKQAVKDLEGNGTSKKK